LKSKRSFNRAIAFRGPFDPALEIINDFGADVFLDPYRCRQFSDQESSLGKEMSRQRN
jgi:hypothetical protein